MRANAPSRRYRVTHHTTYSYDDEVTDSYGMVCTRPRDLPGQEVTEYELWTDPGHADLGTHRDVEGNEFTYFHVTEPHEQLRVSAVSVVAVSTPSRDSGAEGQPWEQCRPAFLGAAQAALLGEYALGSPLVDVLEEARAYAGSSFPPGRGIGAGVLELAHRIHADFEYQPGTTTVTTRVADVLRNRRGVCQDFAHLMLACLRSLGLAARYVSGYLATDPASGQSRVVGADATHAWLEVWLPAPGGGEGIWLPVDPTNDCVVTDRHVTVAYGRDYGDVPPVKGVIFTDATKSTMTVSVDVAPI
ncbi:MAG: transglutaminase family protein [Nocardioidaceae bacterium]